MLGVNGWSCIVEGCSLDTAVWLEFVGACREPGSLVFGAAAHVFYALCFVQCHGVATLSSSCLGCWFS